MGFFKKNKKSPQADKKDVLKLMQSLFALPEDHGGGEANESETWYHLLRRIMLALDISAGSLFVSQKDRDVLMLQKWMGEKPLAATISAEYEFLKFLKQWHQPVIKDEVFRSQEFVEVRSAAAHFFTQLSCAVTIPLFHGQNFLGLLNLGRKVGSLDYDEEDRLVFKNIGSVLSFQISHLLLQADHQRLAERAQESIQVKNDLMANVSQELKTPLSGMLGLTGMLLDEADGPLNPDQRRHLEMIKAAGESLLEIVTNIIDLINVDVADQLSIKRIDLLSMVGEIGELFESFFRMNGNVFQVMIAPDLLVYGDEDKIRTVLINLISNAAKFTRHGQIEVLAQKSGDVAKICVRDTGIGIAEEHFESIFDEFNQVGGSLAREQGGTGLGLALAKKFVERHGGRIWVDSVLGKGSEFYVTLPLKAIDLPASEA